MHNKRKKRKETYSKHKKQKNRLKKTEIFFLMDSSFIGFAKIRNAFSPI